MGKLKGVATPLGKMSDSMLSGLGIRAGHDVVLEFESGVRVSGRLERILRSNARIVLMTFSNCRVALGDRTLFNPNWGPYDMAVGERIASVFGGAADKDAYEQIALVPKERTIKIQLDGSSKRLGELYESIRRVRDGIAIFEDLIGIWSTLRTHFQHDWLAEAEILEILARRNIDPALQDEIRNDLETKARTYPELTNLIRDALDHLTMSI